ncbi:hypothetical protein [Paludibaculum fermentans]|uniref:Uncharacterized protein n=1 Tax=Paludibaculum fermentans TaxID=1473598 RepID=A0A7S7NQH3_PALFE|nr:hypothetical protein [Paludibaculum fermentans]QOY87917.1 hypothetical protein IRI77_35155 [Paludibaculum fermentans]
MGILLGYAPFVVFFAVSNLGGSVMGLVCAAIAAVILTAARALSGKQSVKLLELSSVLLFAGLAAAAYSTDANWTVTEVRLRVDAGLLAIIVASLAIGQPFTLQYAREEVRPELWNNPSFLQTNRIISAAWAGAVLVCICAEVLWIYFPAVPKGVGTIATIGAIYGAVRFTSSYPKRMREQAAVAAE